MDLGPSLWTLNGLGPFFLISLLEAQMFYFPGLQSFALFWALVQHCDFFYHNIQPPELVGCLPTHEQTRLSIFVRNLSLLFQLVSGSLFSFPWDLASPRYPLVSWFSRVTLLLQLPLFAWNVAVKCLSKTSHPLFTFPITLINNYQ